VTLVRKQNHHHNKRQGKVSNIYHKPDLIYLDLKQKSLNNDWTNHALNSCTRFVPQVALFDKINSPLLLDPAHYIYSTLFVL